MDLVLIVTQSVPLNCTVGRRDERNLKCWVGTIPRIGAYRHTAKYKLRIQTHLKLGLLMYFTLKISN